MKDFTKLSKRGNFYKYVPIAIKFARHLITANNVTYTAQNVKLPFAYIAGRLTLIQMEIIGTLSAIMYVKLLKSQNQQRTMMNCLILTIKWLTK